MTEFTPVAYLVKVPKTNRLISLAVYKTLVSGAKGRECKSRIGLFWIDVLLVLEATFLLPLF